MRFANKRIFLFDLGEAILPPRPQFNCAVVSSGGQGWPPLGGHPKGLSLTAAGTAAGLGARGQMTISTASRFHFPCPLQQSGSGSGKPINCRARGLIKKRDPAQPRAGGDGTALWRPTAPRTDRTRRGLLRPLSPDSRISQDHRDAHHDRQAEQATTTTARRPMSDLRKPQ